MRGQIKMGKVYFRKNMQRKIIRRNGKSRKTFAQEFKIQENITREYNTQTNNAQKKLHRNVITQETIMREYNTYNEFNSLLKIGLWLITIDTNLSIVSSLSRTVGEDYKPHGIFRPWDP